VPLPRVPREILNKPSFEDPEYWSLQLFGDSETRLGILLKEDPNREVGAGGYGDYLICGGLNAPFERHSLEFDHSSLARSCVDDVIDPFEGGAGRRWGIANPVPIF